MMLTPHWLWHDFQSPPHQWPGRKRRARLPGRWLLPPWRPRWPRGAKVCRGLGSSPCQSWRGAGAALPGGAGSDG